MSDAGKAGLQVQEEFQLLFAEAADPAGVEEGDEQSYGQGYQQPGDRLGIV